MITPPKLATKLLHDVLRVALVVTVPQQVRDGVILGRPRGDWGNGDLFVGSYPNQAGGWRYMGPLLPVTLADLVSGICGGGGNRGGGGVSGGGNRGGGKEDGRGGGGG